MKRSIRKQMVAVFSGLLAFMFLAILACNVWLLEPFYMKDKQKQIVQLYEAIDQAAAQGNVDESDNNEQFMELVRMAQTDNLFFIMVNMNNGELYSNVRQEAELQRYLNQFVMNREDERDTILKETKDYQISRSKHPETSSEDLMMRGVIQDEYFVLIQCPIESIQSSVGLANRFLIIVGLIMTVLCTVLVGFFSKRLTDPLHELVDLSQRMEQLDFEAKYTRGGEDEIGVLGESFNHMSEKLEETVSELKSANNQLLSDIERKEQLEQMRNEFLGNVSHELKTPIALIQGYAEGLKEGVNDDPESREFYCEVIMDEAQKMNGMVKNLLTLNQLEFGEDEILFERFDLRAMANGVIQSMDYFAEQTGAKVRFQPGDPVYVWGDEYKTEQVIRNYLSNAFHHVSGEMVIEVKIEIENGTAKLTVFNTGTPIPEKDLPHVWEKFYKVDKAHTREYGGNGIGLSIVKAIMESMHQKYGVLNYDNGVAFWFELGIQ